MDLSDLIIFYIIVGVVSLFLYFLLRPNTNSASYKGSKGEYHVYKKLNRIFRNKNCYVFNDILIKHNGDSTQIDHVVLSQHGVFVIETKNYSGWIFGSESSKNWTKVMFKNKYAFQNPIRQNYKHVLILQHILGLNYNKFISIVVFTGSGEFKTQLPENVLKIGDLKNYVNRFSDDIIETTDFETLKQRLELAIVENTRSNLKEHYLSIKKRKN